MRKSVFLISMIAMTVAACDKHDPILPGVRDSVFKTESLQILNESAPVSNDAVVAQENKDCPYTQDSKNTIWDGERKIFSGFATNNSVAGTRTPVCRENFVYAGLTTGELVKINAKNRHIAWIADVFRQSNMMGGASVLDIIAPVQIYKNYVYAGGLGGAFCKFSDSTGSKSWCIDLSVEKPFILIDDVAFVVDTNKNLSAIRLRDGAIYWQRSVNKPKAPKYDAGIITVHQEKFDAKTGTKIED